MEVNKNEKDWSRRAYVEILTLRELNWSWSCSELGRVWDGLDEEKKLTMAGQ